MAMTPRKLSANEVAALVGGLMDNTSFGQSADGVEVRPYTFGSNDLSQMGDYHALRMINERFCRIARSVFLPMLRIQPRISAFPAEMRSFDDYRNSQDNFVSLTNTRIEELRGSHLIVIPPPFISLLTDAYYGGSIRYVKNGRNEFTATEQRVIEIVTDRLNNALQLAWRDLMQLTFAVQTREENMQFAAFVDGDDMIVNCSFMVQLPDAEPASFDILYPLQTLKPIASQLRSRTQSDSLEDDASWRERLERAVMTIPLAVRTRLCEPEIPLKRLASLKEGDVVPAKVTDKVEILIDGKVYFEAVPGELGGKSALSISKRVKG
ncbi:flagellar motor switch protein FliM [Fuscovulum ytuae]|uniref:Flagellar motor switch protein FliM n=1 Tax=Fuscovulum ytuae TaxID=3042299 RepID=A0ABY8Q2S6_9RHOB|nr:flagellar motor switch protein FliM [Fuscovulum sp. YMD61]WGV14921.1 flagellar motor switch protein FliM [Fuscovulum sp. YMD61]